MSWMASRNACRAASQYARRIGNHTLASADDSLRASRSVNCSRWFASSNNANNAATLPKVQESPHPKVVVPLASQTHTSAVLVPPQQVDGTNVVVKLQDEYPCEVVAAPVELPKKEDLDQFDQSHFATPKVADNEPASSALPKLDEGERQAHSNSYEARKDSVDKKETAKFAAIAATW